MGNKRARILESYKHKAAKLVLGEWLLDEYDEVRYEEKFKIDTWSFYPDVTVYNNGHLQAIYEVTHTHPVDAKKLARIQSYCYRNGNDILLHEVDAEWILRQVCKPDMIIKFTFETVINGK